MSNNNVFYYDDCCMIIWPLENNDGETTIATHRQSPQQKLLEYTLDNGQFHYYVGLFETSSTTKAEICCDIEYDGNYTHYYSGLIDISKPKIYIVNDYNYSSGQEPPK